MNRSGGFTSFESCGRFVRVHIQYIHDFFFYKCVCFYILLFQDFTSGHVGLFCVHFYETGFIIFFSGYVIEVGQPSSVLTRSDWLSALFNR